jgi:uncharacterized protein (TIGR03437 family)
MVNLYGTFGVSTQVEKVLPIPTMLGGVQVFVNGQAAPVYQVSQNQISALIPYEVAGEYFATFQVVVNGSKSNLVTVYVDNSAPGIYTLTENGIGAGAILHSNYTQVTGSSPAVPGETVLVFLNGLGPVTPQVADGAAASGSPLSVSVEAPDIAVFLEEPEDFAFPEISFAGLAPGLPGLYQVNFTMPTSGLENGDVDIVFYTTEAMNNMATISVSGFSARAVETTGGYRASKPRSRAIARRKAGKHPKDFRRALPSRPE